MERWNCTNNTNGEFKKVDDFIEAVLSVCKEHGFSIGHEDGHGAFEVYSGYDDDNASWLRSAHYYPPAKEE